MGRLDIPRLKAEQQTRQMQERSEEADRPRWSRMGLISHKEDEAAALAKEMEDKEKMSLLSRFQQAASEIGRGQLAEAKRDTGVAGETGRVWMDVPGVVAASTAGHAIPKFTALSERTGIPFERLTGIKLSEAQRKAATPKANPIETFQAFREGFQEGGMSGATESAWEEMGISPESRSEGTCWNETWCGWRSGASYWGRAPGLVERRGSSWASYVYGCWSPNEAC